KQTLAPQSTPNAFGVKLLDCIWQAGRTIFFFPCRSLWTFATSAIFSRLPKREVLAGPRTGSAFPNRVFRSKCGIWKPVFACLCFSAEEGGFCLLHGV